MKRFVDTFSIWFIAVTILGLVYPPALSWFQLEWIGPMLMVIMLAMGLTLTWDDFSRVGRAPKPIFLGVVLQFTIMPLAGYSIAWLYGLDAPLAVGLILVAACPGGTASNVVAYIARADVALSVSMTLVSTLAAVVATPFLTAALAGSRVEVDPMILLGRTVAVILVPILAGLTIRSLLPGVARRFLPFAPLVAVVFLLVLIGGTVANMQPAMLEAGLLLLGAIGTVHVVGAVLGYVLGRLLSGKEVVARTAAIGLVHVVGAVLGYVLGRLLSGKEVVARTVAIEVSMQNAGIGIALAESGAFVSPLVVLPSIFSGLWSCLIGSILAGIWSHLPIPGPDAVVKRRVDPVPAAE